MEETLSSEETVSQTHPLLWFQEKDLVPGRVVLALVDGVAGWREWIYAVVTDVHISKKSITVRLLGWDKGWKTVVIPFNHIIWFEDVFVLSKDESDEDILFRVMDAMHHDNENWAPGGGSSLMGHMDVEIWNRIVQRLNAKSKNYTVSSAKRTTFSDSLQLIYHPRKK